jgi:hypothetical protein
MFAGGAWAQSLTGGCSATINGRAPAQLTKDNPLGVAKGEKVTLEGTAPASAGKGGSSTSVRVETPFWAPDISFGPYKGKGTAWGGTVDVPDILFSLAPGIYRVNGTATGSGWRCVGSAYVDIGKTSPASAALGGAAVLGGGAAVRSGRKRKKKAKPRLKDDPNAMGRAIVNIIRELGPELKARFGADLFLIIALLIMFVVLGIFGLGGSS